MTTECTTERLEFERFRRQRVVGRFDGGELGSDGGGLLLRELALRTGLFRRLSACFRDHRDSQRTQHPVEVLVAARVLGLALGYEDLIDHDTLRQSKLWSLLSKQEHCTERLPYQPSACNCITTHRVRLRGSNPGGAILLTRCTAETPQQVEPAGPILERAACGTKMPLSACPCSMQCLVQ